MINTSDDLTDGCITLWRNVAQLLLLTFVATLLLGCMSSVSDRTKLLYSEHELVGKLWDVKQQAFIDRATLMNRMRTSEYLLLGEKHDNPIHHQHQTWAIRELAKSQPQASVAFEMIDLEQGARLTKQQITSADQLITSLNKSKSGWDYDQHYKGLFAAVIAAGYKINAANLSGKQLMQTVMQGEEQLPASYKKILDETPFSEQQMAALQTVINQSHCNLLDENTSRKMTLGQRVRDVVMTESLLTSSTPAKVLIAGSGHVRNDRAVPLYLKTQVKDASILSIGLLEVDSDLKDVAAYAQAYGGNSLPFDVVWFTPQVQREDPCIALRQHFKRKSE